MAGRPLDATALKRQGRELVRGWMDPLASRLASTGVHPNWISAVGLLLTVVAAYFYLRGEFLAASLCAIVGSSLDALDGAVARYQGRESAFGAFLDSTLDRVSDTLLFGGVAAYYFYKPVLAASSLVPSFEHRLSHQDPLGDWLRGLAAVAALAGAYLVSYTRARAEGLGLDCKVGWFERPERLIVLLGASLFGAGVLMDFSLAILVILSWITAVQRFVYVQKKFSGTQGRSTGHDRKRSGRPGSH